MFTSLDKITQEISSRFQQLHESDNHFCFLVPSKLLDPEYDCNLESVPVDVSKEEFQLEKQRLQNVTAGPERQEDIMDNGFIELLQSNSSTSVFLFQILS